MRRLFHMSDLGLLSYYLGIEVKQSRDAVTLCQATYERKLLEKAQLEGCNACQMPMEVRLKLSKNSTTPEVDSTMYRSLVGSLRYLVHTRPNIAFAVGYVSRFMEKPQQEHLVAVKHLLRYISGTIDYGIMYSKRSNGDSTADPRVKLSEGGFHPGHMIRRTGVENPPGAVVDTLLAELDNSFSSSRWIKEESAGDADASGESVLRIHWVQSPTSFPLSWTNSSSSSRWIKEDSAASGE